MRRGRKGWAIKKTKFLHSRNCSKNRATEAMKRIEQVLSVIIIFIFDDKKKKNIPHLLPTKKRTHNFKVRKTLEHQKIAQTS